ncbi:hypothetical protein K488DRAFT_37314, partial [Vararia minispora EC-137]
PFNDSDSDIILRSLTGVNFMVYKGPLRMASPFFRDMFSLPQSKQCSIDDSTADFYKGIPCVQMSEDTQTLHRFLSFIFPGEPSMPTSFREFAQLLAVFQKYDVRAEMGLLRRLLAGDDMCAITPTNALQVYAVAHEHRLTEEALAAAQLMMEIPLTFQTICDSSTDVMSGAALYHLHQYRLAC